MNTTQTRPPARQAYFNTIEIVLALVIISVGIIGLLGLMPVSQDANRGALSKSNAADSADQFMRYYSSKLKINWAVASTLPISKPGDVDTSAIWQSVDNGKMLTDMKGVILSYNDTDNDRTFDYLVDATTDSRDDSGLFRIQTKTDTNVVDFDAVMRVWRTPATYKTYDASTGVWYVKPVPPDNGATINVEVSYPTTVPYARREKQVFMMDVFRPVAVSASQPTGAFTIPVDGTLRITYHGSNAGWRSYQSFWMVYPDEDASTPTGHKEEKIFNSATTSDQNATFDREYSAGSSFNCFISTSLSVNGKASPFRHYAWADADTDSFYFDSTSTNNGYRHYSSGKPYCIAVEQVSGHKWFFGFEDIPGDSGPDWDYEDCMVTIELIETGSDSLFGSVVGTTVTTSSPIKLSNASGWDCVIVKATDGKSMSTDMGGEAFYAYTGRVTCAWFRPKGAGSQSLTVGGETQTFENTDLVAVSDLSESMTVTISKSGSDWYMTINAPNCTYTTIK